jgi:lipoprotein-anchoring transpeptidase ErfK/SrfK
MDSATIGIPRDSPRGYYLRDVLYTQYFTTDGAAIHYNYWSSHFGYAGTHGCLGVNLEDARWFWEWADVGTIVHIH